MHIPRWIHPRARCTIGQATPDPSSVATEKMNAQQAADLMSRYLAGTATPEDMADLLIPPGSAVDLRAVPADQWAKHLMGSVKLPEDIRAFVDGQEEFSREELDRLEDRIAAFYGIAEPYYITCEPGPPFEAWLGTEAKPLP
jgi:hypothetical protein